LILAEEHAIGYAITIIGIDYAIDSQPLILIQRVVDDTPPLREAIALLPPLLIGIITLLPRPLLHISR